MQKTWQTASHKSSMTVYSRYCDVPRDWISCPSNDFCSHICRKNKSQPGSWDVSPRRDVLNAMTWWTSGHKSCKEISSYFRDEPPRAAANLLELKMSVDKVGIAMSVLKLFRNV